MEQATRRPLVAIATLTTAGALALAPITVTPPDMRALALSPVTISAQGVELTNAWTDLASNTAASLAQLGGLFIGTNTSFPLPTPTIPLAPIATQLVLNQLIYAVQLFTGDAGNIPLEIGTHLKQVGGTIYEIAVAGSSIIPQQLTVPFYAAQKALEFIANSTNKLTALFEAPAIFLNLALNADAGLLGQYGPIGFGLIFRNLLTSALYTPPPAGLPFKKAASTPAAAVTVAPAPAAGSGTASSARTKTESPKSSSRKASGKSASKAPSAKSSAKSGAGAGQGHSKRG